MAARYKGASFELPAFSVVITLGLGVLNPGMVSLSRNIFWGIILSCFIGLVPGRNAQEVAAAQNHKRETEIRKRFHGMQALTAGDGLETRSTDRSGGSMAS